MEAPHALKTFHCLIYMERTPDVVTFFPSSSYFLFFFFNILLLIFWLKYTRGKYSAGIKCHKSAVVNEAIAVYPKGGSKTKEGISSELMEK